MWENRSSAALFLRSTACFFDNPRDIAFIATDDWSHENLRSIVGMQLFDAPNHRLYQGRLRLHRNQPFSCRFQSALPAVATGDRLKMMRARDEMLLKERLNQSCCSVFVIDSEMYLAYGVQGCLRFLRGGS